MASSSPLPLGTPPGGLVPGLFLEFHRLRPPCCSVPCNAPTLSESFPITVTSSMGSSSKVDQRETLRCDHLFVFTWSTQPPIYTTYCTQSPIYSLWIYTTSCVHTAPRSQARMAEKKAEGWQTHTYIKGCMAGPTAILSSASLPRYILESNHQVSGLHKPIELLLPLLHTKTNCHQPI